jgi:hypothetical protein
VAEEHLNLSEICTVIAAKIGARAAQVPWINVDPCCSSISGHNSLNQGR